MYLNNDWIEAAAGETVEQLSGDWWVANPASDESFHGKRTIYIRRNARGVAVEATVTTGQWRSYVLPVADLRCWKNGQQPTDWTTIPVVGRWRSQDGEHAFERVAA